MTTLILHAESNREIALRCAACGEGGCDLAVHLKGRSGPSIVGFHADCVPQPVSVPTKKPERSDGPYEQMFDERRGAYEAGQVGFVSRGQGK